MFYVGQKVVALPEIDRWRPVFGNMLPPSGSVSTVLNVYTPPDGKLAIELAEWPQPGDASYHPGFMAKYFRPVVERKTSIAIFTAMLNPSKQRVGA